MRSRQNKLIENEALAEVQLAAFPWESLSLSPSARPSRTNGGTRVLRNPVVPWTRIRKRGVERRNPCENDLTSPRRGGRGAWPITDGRAERQSHPLRSRVRENPIAYPFDRERGRERERSLPARPIFRPLVRRGEKNIGTSRIGISRIFSKGWGRTKVSFIPPSPLNPLYGVVARLEDK